MKNKNLVYAVILLALVALVVWFSFFKNENTTRPQLYNFSVLDTASIVQITIQNKRPQKTVLTKTEEGWKVSGQYFVRPDAMRTLLETLYRQEMRTFTPEAAKERIVNMMSTQGTEVIVESFEGTMLHFFVGGNAPDMLGTYMMIKGSDGPYAVHIPGFNGFLSSRYFSDPAQWRDRTLISAPAAKITEVTLNYAEAPQSSFRITKDDSGVISVVNPITGADLPFNEEAVLGYLEDFKRIYFEGVISSEDRIWPKRDSIVNSIPIFTLRVDQKNGKTWAFQAFNKSAQDGETSKEGNLQSYDRDRYYALLNDTDFVLIQNYALRRILREASYFE